MPVALLLLGTGLTIGGTALLCWQASLIVTGLLLLLAGIDLRR